MKGALSSFPQLDAPHLKMSLPCIVGNSGRKALQRNIWNENFRFFNLRTYDLPLTVTVTDSNLNTKKKKFKERTHIYVNSVEIQNRDKLRRGPKIQTDLSKGSSQTILFWQQSRRVKISNEQQSRKVKVSNEQQSEKVKVFKWTRQYHEFDKPFVNQTNGPDMKVVRKKRLIKNYLPKTMQCGWIWNCKWN